MCNEILFDGDVFLPDEPVLERRTRNKFGKDSNYTKFVQKNDKKMFFFPGGSIRLFVNCLKYVFDIEFFGEYIKFFCERRKELNYDLIKSSAFL